MSSSMHHIFMVLDTAGGMDRCKSFLQKQLPQRLDQDRTRKFCLHYPESVKLLRYLPRHSNLKLEPLKVRPTREHVQKLAKRCDSVEWVEEDAPVQEKAPERDQTSSGAAQQEDKRQVKMSMSVAAKPKWEKGKRAVAVEEPRQETVAEKTREQEALWREVFLEKSVYEAADMAKLRGVAGLVYVNMDQSVHRREHMEKWLQQVPWLQAKRVSAVHVGCKSLPIEEMAKVGRLTPREACCTLSHIKALTMVSRMQGEWFLVVEDDVAFQAGAFLPHTLEEIALMAPHDAQIVKLHTTSSSKNQKEWFEEWGVHRRYSTQGYMVRGTFAKSVAKELRIEQEKNELHNERQEPLVLSVADDFVYRLGKTYEYKYNFLDSLNEDSTIHGDHLASHVASQQHNFERLVKDWKKQQK